MDEIALQAVTALGTPRGAAGRVVFDSPELRVAEEPFLDIWSLRVSRKGDASPAFGLAAPLAPNHFSGDAAQACAWIEPHAWLVLGTRAEPAPRADHGVLVTDLSCRFAAFRISGRDAAELLSAGLSLASVPGALKTGRCARAKFAEEVDVFVQQLADTPDYRLLIDVGLAGFAADWLVDAARLVTTRID